MAPTRSPPPSEYDEAIIARCRRQISTTPSTSPDLRIHLNNLETHLNARYAALTSPSDLDEIIQVSRRGLEITPPGDPDRSRILSNLGSKLLIRSDRSNSIADVDESIAVSRQAVETLQEAADQEMMPVFLGNLGSALHHGFDHRGDLRELKEAILVSRQAIEVARNGGVDMPGLLGNLWKEIDALFHKIEELGVV